MSRLALGMLGAALTATAVDATTFQFEAAGKITSSYGANVADPQVGTDVRIDAKFSTNSMNISNEQFGQPLYSFQNATFILTVGIQTFTYSSDIQSVNLSLSDNYYRIDLMKTVDMFNISVRPSDLNPATDLPFSWPSNFVAFSVGYGSVDPSHSAITSSYLNDGLSLSGFPLGSIGFGASGATSKSFQATATSASLTAIPDAVPEAFTWVMFIGGFGMVACGMRRRRRTTVRFV